MFFAYRSEERETFRWVELVVIREVAIQMPFLQLKTGVGMGRRIRDISFSFKAPS